MTYDPLDPKRRVLPPYSWEYGPLSTLSPVDQQALQLASDIAASQPRNVNRERERD